MKSIVYLHKAVAADHTDLSSLSDFLIDGGVVIGL